MEKVSPIKAWSDGDRDMLAELSKSDDAYYAMPNVGDRGWSTFRPAAAPGNGTDRFPAQQRLLSAPSDRQRKPRYRNLGANRQYPDAAARFAIKRYNEWRVAQASK